MSRIPIEGEKTLVYGSQDAGCTIKMDNEIVVKKLNRIGIELGLKLHLVKPRHNQDDIKHIHTPVVSNLVRDNSEVTLFP